MHLVWLFITACAAGFDMRLHFGTKTSYYPQQLASTYTAPPPELSCSPDPIYINLVARHGTRNPTSGDTQSIGDLAGIFSGFASQVDPKYSWITSWVSPYTDSTAGLLVDLGSWELYSLAQRVKAAWPSAWTTPYGSQLYTVQTSQVPRSGQSGNAFGLGLWEGTGHIGLHNAQPFYQYSLSKSKDLELRFYDNCPAYDVAKDSEFVQSELESLESTFSSLQSRLASKLGVGSVWQPTFLELEAVYDACSFDVALRNDTSQFCALLDEETILTFEYYYDVKNYLTKGYGQAINYEIATLLLQDIVESFEESLDSHSKAKLRFGHAETIFPLVSILGLFKDPFPLLANTTYPQREARLWESSVISPFAANTLFIHYQCRDGSYVKILHNEKEYVIPGCEGLFCSWSRFKSIFSDYLNLDFKKLCDDGSASSDSQSKSNPSSPVGWIVLGCCLSLVVGAVVGGAITHLYQKKQSRVQSASFQPLQQEME